MGNIQSSSVLPKVRIGEIAIKVGSGATPRGGKESYKADGISLIRSMNVYDLKFYYTDLAFIDKNQAKLLDNVTVKKDDVLLNITGASVARCCIVPDRILPARVNQHVAIIRLDKTKANPYFLQYCLVSPLYKDHLLSIAQGGATREALTKEKIEEFCIPFPNLSVQHKIAAILSAYDDLIENNLWRIKILEEMAQNIYREWFVNFRFPGHENTRFVDSPLGKIPEGWEVKCLGEVSENYDKLRKPLSSIDRAKRKGIYPYYGAAKVIDYIDDYIFDGKYLLVAEDGSVITDGQKPVLQYVDCKFWANNHVHILKGKGDISTEHLYLALYHTNISGYITGAAQPKISQANLNRIPFLMPKETIMKSFNNIVINIFKQKMLFTNANVTLRQTRDILLPKLISGEVDVSELDIKVPEEAVS